MTTLVRAALAAAALAPAAYAPSASAAICLPAPVSTICVRPEYLIDSPKPCTVDVGYCAPGARCQVNVGYCAPGGRCVVNVGYCDDSTSLPVGT